MCPLVGVEVHGGEEVVFEQRPQRGGLTHVPLTIRSSYATAVLPHGLRSVASVWAGGRGERVQD